MKKINETLRAGKITEGNRRQQLYINITVILGVILIFFWTSLYEKTFIDIKIILSILIFSSLFASFFLFKTYITICGYSRFIKRNMTYNLLIRISVFILIALPIGNLSVFIFLYKNQHNADEKTQIIIVEPQNIYESDRKGHKYVGYEMSFDGITKNFSDFNRPIEEIQNSKIKFEIRKGFFGYDFYENYNFENEKKW